MEIRLKATGRHLPYGITQCYLPPDTSERAPIAARPGIEPTTAWSQVRRPNRYATKPPISIWDKEQLH